MKSDSDRTTLHRELGTVEYRSMTNPVEKAAHLHLNTGATKKDCAQICDASYDAVKELSRQFAKIVQFNGQDALITCVKMPSMNWQK
ncbi:hypothetical protein BLNAU_24519 [Blattamonas nauphoetae]|uniref:Uncharacterized protein n=1 Tax=Blattamonas nauphoetae TaxID=2049346 RepID=A0ABQ9WP98_9EUKA|nr:hypothetical protein BLNAU_24519 [Blattamonas nauphoetae]